MRVNTPPRTGGFCLGLLILLLFAVAPAYAIEELEAEQDISDLLPDQFPIAEAPRDPSARRWAIVPQLGYGPATGVVGGIKFSHRDLFGTGTTIDIDGTYAFNEQQSLEFSLGSPHLLEDRGILLFRSRYHMDPQREFFGLGNNDLGRSPEPLSTHEFQELGGAMTMGWRPFERVAFNFAVGIRQVDIRRGTRKCGVPFTREEFPDLPGVNGGIVNPLALSLVWNTRDDVARPTRGWRVILKVIHTNKAFFSDFEYTRYLADAGYLRSLSGGRYVFGVRVNGEWVAGPEHQIPFWELSELGGQDTLRGFFPHRFVGKGRVLVNGEFRFRLTEFDFYDLWRVRLDGVLFGDGGRVFIDSDDLEDEFSLGSNIVRNIIDDFQYDYGFGFRIALSQALIARIDVGFSDEETGLVYLAFGHTF